MRISDWSSDVCSSDLGLARLILFRFPPRLQATTTPAKQRFAGVFVLRRHASRRERKAVRCHHLGLTPDGARAAIKHTQGHASAVADAAGAVHPGGVQPCNRMPQPTTWSRSEEHTSELQS